MRADKKRNEPEEPSSQISNETLIKFVQQKIMVELNKLKNESTKNKVIERMKNSEIFTRNLENILGKHIKRVRRYSKNRLNKYIDTIIKHTRDNKRHGFPYSPMISVNTSRSPSLRAGLSSFFSKSTRELEVKWEVLELVAYIRYASGDYPKGISLRRAVEHVLGISHLVKVGSPCVVTNPTTTRLKGNEATLHENGKICVKVPVFIEANKDVLQDFLKKSTTTTSPNFDKTEIERLSSGEEGEEIPLLSAQQCNETTSTTTTRLSTEDKGEDKTKNLSSDEDGTSCLSPMKSAP